MIYQNIECVKSNRETLCCSKQCEIILQNQSTGNLIAADFRSDSTEMKINKVFCDCIGCPLANTQEQRGMF